MPISCLYNFKSHLESDMSLKPNIKFDMSLETRLECAMFLKPYVRKVWNSEAGDLKYVAGDSPGVLWRWRITISSGRLTWSAICRWRLRWKTPGQSPLSWSLHDWERTPWCRVSWSSSGWWRTPWTPWCGRSGRSPSSGWRCLSSTCCRSFQKYNLELGKCTILG